VRKGKLKPRRDEETGRWLLDAHSVHDHRQKAAQTGLLGASGITTTDHHGSGVRW